MHVRCTAKEFVRKGDLWNIAITKIPLFSPFERRLLTAYLPHQYRKRKFDVENPRALAELNQLCFNFAITIDYTAAKIQVQPGASSNVVPGFVAEKLNVLNPALRELNLGITSVLRDDLEFIHEMKMRALEAIAFTISKMNLRKRQAVRLPDYERLMHAVHDFEALELSRLKLENHFKKNLPILLVGSFVRTDSHSSGAGKAPSDIDMRIISPAATAQDYVPDMAFASILRNSGQLAATFMVVPSDYSDAFFLSNTSDKPLDAASTILLGAPYSFSVLADGEERPFMLSKTVRTMFNLRAALAKVETYKASAQLKSQLNIPYYALKILRGIFGKIEGVSARKFTEEDTHQCNALYDFVEANISMQKVIDAYGEHLEKDMRN